MKTQASHTGFRKLDKVAVRALAVLLALLLGSGCDWTEFDDLADEAPVRVVGTPDDLGKYRPAAVSLTSQLATTQSADTVAVAGFGVSPVVTLRLGPDGKTTRSVGAAPSWEPELGAITSLLQVGDNGQAALLLVGAPDIDAVYVTSLADGIRPEVASEGPIRPLSIPFGDRFGGSLAAGDLGPLSSTSEPAWIVASNEAIHIQPDRATDPTAWLRCDAPLSCETSCQDYHSDHRALTVARLMAVSSNDDARETLAVGLPAPDDESAVRLIHYSGDTPPSGQTCDEGNGFFSTDLRAPAASERFGSALLAADLDDDGWDELLVGDPGAATVFVFAVSSDQRDASPLGSGWQGVTPIGELTPTDTDTAGDFGQALTALDLDGDGKREIAVGDPAATISGNANAGRVHLFAVELNGMTLSADEIGTLTDHEASEAKHVGQALSRIAASSTLWSPEQPIREDLFVVSDSRLYVFSHTSSLIDFE